MTRQERADLHRRIRRLKEQIGNVVYDPVTDQLYINREEPYNDVWCFRTDMWTPWMLVLRGADVNRIVWLGKL